MWTFMSRLVNKLLIVVPSFNFSFDAEFATLCFWGVYVIFSIARQLRAGFIDISGSIHLSLNCCFWSLSLSLSLWYVCQIYLSSSFVSTLLQVLCFNHCFCNDYIWIRPPIVTREKSVVGKIEGAEKIPRPALESSRWEESKYTVTIFCRIHFDLFF